MRDDLRDAIESSRSVETEKRRHSFAHVRAIVLAVVQELPGDITAAELVDELTIGNNQGGEHD